MTEMHEEDILLEPDEPPTNGEWVDIDEVIASPTDDELDEGEEEGLSIDPDDDFDGSEFGDDEDQLELELEQLGDLDEI